VKIPSIEIYPLKARGVNCIFDTEIVADLLSLQYSLFSGSPSHFGENKPVACVTKWYSPQQSDK